MFLTRRGIASALFGFASSSASKIAVGKSMEAASSNAITVPTVTSRAELSALPQQPLVRAERFSSDGPPIDMLYESVVAEPTHDQTRVTFVDGRWGRQIFPTGVINARAFGAMGDGAADDSAPLQNFLDAVVTTGSRGFIPAGCYRTTVPLRVGGFDSGERYRGFTIEGSGRTGLSSGSLPGGTLILLDTPDKNSEAVLIWCKDAWRDARLTGVGLACKQIDGAQYGLLLSSTEISHLGFDNLHVENVTTAFGVLAGSGANGEFCSWSHVQTWKIKNFFYSNAGQAYGLRFSNIFCYYRPGGTLFSFDTPIVGGGLHLTNFDASPVREGSSASPADRANTTLFKLSDKHNAPVTMIGGRLEHITTIAELESRDTDIIVHNQLQFIGCDFVTDLDRAGILAGLGTISLRNQVFADLNFLNCSFASAFPNNEHEMILIRADRNCRGNIKFVQCGHWGYAEPPIYDGPAGDNIRLSWVDCAMNIVAGADFPGRAMGRRFDRSINAPHVDGEKRISAETGRIMSYLGNSWLEVPLIIVASGPPLEGSFRPGDICQNSSPAPGRPLAWVCVKGGEPGDWHATGSL